MKTPREILLERHRKQTAALDDVRASVIAGAAVTKVGQVSNLSPASVSDRPRTTFHDTERHAAPCTERGNSTTHVEPGSAISATNGEAVDVGLLSSGCRSAVATTRAPAEDRLEVCPTLLAAVRAWLNFRRMAWGLLGLAWCAIIALNVAANSDLGSASAPAPKQDSQLLAGYRDYREQLALLLNEPTEEQKDISSPNTKAAPGPRSDADRVRKDASNCLTREWA